MSFRASNCVQGHGECECSHGEDVGDTAESSGGLIIGPFQSGGKKAEEGKGAQQTRLEHHDWMPRG